MIRFLSFMSICPLVFILTNNIGHADGVTDNGTVLYVADTFNHVVKSINKKTGEAVIFAGKAGKSGSANGKRTAARFNNPNGIANDGENLFIADTNNHVIRRINFKTGVVSTFAGKAGETGTIDGEGAKARFNSPNGVFNSGENLYITDTNNQTIRKINKESVTVSTVAGIAGVIGSADGAVTKATFSFPSGITGDGNVLYVSDTNNHTIRKIVIATGEVSTLAGSAGKMGITNAVGASAEFYNPRGLAVVGSNLYVADSNNAMVRKIDIKTKEVATFTGDISENGIIDGTGSEARFITPIDLVGDVENLYVTDTGTKAIRKIVMSTAEVITLGKR
jgi:sugar lactone lactonase YvrE